MHKSTSSSSFLSSISVLTMRLLQDSSRPLCFWLLHQSDLNCCQDNYIATNAQVNFFFFFSLFHQRADDEALTRFLQTSLFLVASPILVKSMFLSFRSSLTLSIQVFLCLPLLLVSLCFSLRLLQGFRWFTTWVALLSPPLPDADPPPLRRVALLTSLPSFLFESIIM